VPQRIERNALTASDVENAAACFDGRLARQHVRAYDVLDEREIPRLLAVTKNDRRTVGESERDELRDDRRVLRLGILTRAKHVEIPERNGLEPVTRVERTHVAFARKLRNRVR